MRVLIVRNDYSPAAVDASLMLIAYLSTQSIDYDMCTSRDLEGPFEGDKAEMKLPQDVDMVIALGGDGTLLAAARLVSTTGIPLLGINYGYLGFLANEAQHGVIDAVAEAFSGESRVDNRTNLRIDVVCEGDKDPWALELSDEEPDFESSRILDYEEIVPLPNVDGSNRSFFALNEVAITRGGNGRIIEFGLNINDSEIAQMRGDGVIVASASGSTGYALSAGGPLTSPEFSGLIVVPIACHTLHSRPIITAPTDVVLIDLECGSETRNPTLYIDGEVLTFDKPVRKVYIRRGAVDTKLLRIGSRKFYAHASDVFF